jgi:hypothetical protein
VQIEMQSYSLAPRNTNTGEKEEAITSATPAEREKVCRSELPNTTPLKTKRPAKKQTFTIP